MYFKSNFAVKEIRKIKTAAGEVVDLFSPLRLPPVWQRPHHSSLLIVIWMEKSPFALGLEQRWKISKKKLNLSIDGGHHSAVAWVTRGKQVWVLPLLMCRSFYNLTIRHCDRGKLCPIETFITAVIDPTPSSTSYKTSFYSISHQIQTRSPVWPLCVKYKPFPDLHLRALLMGLGGYHSPTHVND